jgi:hypothetical protein
MSDQPWPAPTFEELREALADVLWEIPHADEATVLDIAVKALSREPLDDGELDLLAANLIRIHCELKELQRGTNG